MLLKLTLLFMAMSVAIDNINATLGLHVKPVRKARHLFFHGHHRHHGHGHHGHYGHHSYHGHHGLHGHHGTVGIGIGSGIVLNEQVTYIINEAHTASTILLTMWESLRVKIDTILSLLPISTEQTPLQIATIVTEIAGLVPGALISTTMHLANIKLRLDIGQGVQLTMDIKQKLYDQLSSVVNRLISSRDKLTQAVDAARVTIASGTASAHMKIKAHYVVATFTAQIAQIDTLMSNAHYASNYFKFGLTSKQTINISVTGDGGNGPAKDSGQSLAELLTALRELLDKLLAFLSTDVNNIIAIVTKLSEKSSNTWISIRVTLRDIEGKLLSGSQLDEQNRKKYLADIDALVKSLLGLQIRFEQTLKAVYKAANKVSDKHRDCVNSVESELKNGLAQIKILISEAKNIIMIVNSDSSGKVTDVTFNVRKDVWNPSESTTNLISALSLLRVKIEELVACLRLNKYDKVTNLIKLVVTTASKIWISIAQFNNNIDVRLKSSTESNEFDRSKYLAEVTVLQENLSSLKIRFEQALKFATEAAVRASVAIKIVLKTIMAALRTVIAKIELKISESNKLQIKIQGSLDESVTVDNGPTLPQPNPITPTNVGDKVKIFVTIINLGLTDNRVNQVESIVTDLEKLISTSIISINTTLDVIKTKLSGGQQLENSEKLELSSNITVVLSTLINLKTKIELALNTAIKSNDKNTDSVKIKADDFLLALRSQIIHIDQQIAQAIQLQINLNSGVSTETVIPVTEGTVSKEEDQPIDESIAVEKSTTTQTFQTSTIEELGIKVNLLIDGLKNKDFEQIKDIVNQLKEPALKALQSVTTFITTMKTSLSSVSKISESAKAKYLADITALLKSLLSIKVKCVLVLKATNEAAIEANGSVKAKIDKLISAFSTHMALIDAKITEVLQIQFKLNGGKAINFKFESETKQTLNIEGVYKTDESGTDAVLLEENIPQQININDN